MMELLWKSQDRHGTADPNMDEVGIEQARDSVVLGLFLVHLAQQGGFIRAEP